MRWRKKVSGVPMKIKYARPKLAAQLGLSIYACCSEVRWAGVMVVGLSVSPSFGPGRGEGWEVDGAIEACCG